MTNRSTTLSLVALGLTLGLAGPAAASEGAYQAAVDHCTNELGGDERQRKQCIQHAQAMAASIDAANSGSDVTIHLDFDSSNDSDAVTSAKEQLDEAMNRCEGGAVPQNQRSSCRMEAFRAYHAAAIGN